MGFIERERYQAQIKNLLLDGYTKLLNEIVEKLFDLDESSAAADTLFEQKNLEWVMFCRQNNMPEKAYLMFRKDKQMIFDQSREMKLKFLNGNEMEPPSKSNMELPDSFSQN